MERRRLVAEIASELGVPEEVVERTVYALLERFGEGPPTLTAQLVSELREIAHQIGRFEGEFREFRKAVEPRLEEIAEFRAFRKMAEPRLEQIGELAQRLERLESEFREFRKMAEPRLEQVGELMEFKRMAEPRLARIDTLAQQVERLTAAFLEFKGATEKRMDRLERWLFAFLVPILLALLSLVVRVFFLP